MNTFCAGALAALGVDYLLPWLPTWAWWGCVFIVVLWVIVKASGDVLGEEGIDNFRSPFNLSDPHDGDE